ncbi:MAG: endolytic transglycosylase MltG [Vibrio sp.]
MIKKLVVLFTLVLVVLLGVGFYAKSQVAEFLAQPVQVSSNQLFKVGAGKTLTSVVAQMEKNGWIKASPFPRLLPHLHPELAHLKVGTYQVGPNTVLENVLKTMVAGTEFQYSITFVEGSRFTEWRDLLNKAEGLEHKTQGMSEADIAKELGIDHDKLEGLFLAETYNYTEGMTDLDILKRANLSLQTELDKAWENKQANLPLKSPYEALILASIIEKETGIENERNTISSVFINRLNKGIRLQTDPTVIYGMGDKYDGNIRKSDLNRKTAYNTYTIDGLPPTPIAMPGTKSINAAVNPEKTSYLFFVASGDGGHVFSKTLAEHNRAVRSYLHKLRSQ